MSKILSFIVAFIVITNVLLSDPCPPGDVSINSQSDLEKFIEEYPDCEEILGSLQITGNVEDLTPLRKIKKVVRGLSIHYTDRLEELTGLDSIESIFS